MTHVPRGALRTGWLLLIAGAALAALVASTQTCLRLGLTRGLWLRECPDGELRQTIAVTAPALTRGAPARVAVRVDATYLTAPRDTRRTEPVTRFTPTLSLVTPDGETTLEPRAAWTQRGDGLEAEVTLPRVHDGTWQLRARVVSPIGESVLELPLPLYTPARVHVLTDRPLYEPGHTVRFRALALKASDLTPLEERPGTWRVLTPSGEVVLEEKAPSGAWGVVAGSFPLDRGAPSGEWTVAWESGGEVGSRTFTVKPFTLPRFRIEAAAARPFSRAGERPRLEGAVTYSSGAPVADAQLELSWSASGAWPPPTAWLEGGALPRTAKTSAAGRFAVELPTVPADLLGQATLTARIAAVDASGDRVEGQATVLLSQDAIAVAAVTELADGLVEGFNNRLYLRATTADGRVLEGVTLTVRRLWERGDPGVDAAVDEDGVASLQLDPGPAVNVVVPAPPFRAPPRARAVQRVGLNERLGLLEDGDISLADRLAFDRLDAPLEACARFVREPDEAVEVGLLVRASGAVALQSVPPGKLGACVGRVLGGLRLGPGAERFFEAAWSFSDEDLPGFELELEGHPDVPEWLHAALTDALVDGRDCLPPTAKSGELPRLLEWKVTPGDARVPLGWAAVPGEPLPDAALACLANRVREARIPAAALSEDLESTVPAIGVARLSVRAPEKYEALAPKDTVMTGYEFLVTARRGREVLGSTRLRAAPGAIPPLRLRASAQRLTPGQQVTVELLRGPDFTGELPEVLVMTHAFEKVEAKVHRETRSATFTVPATWQGWAAVQWGSGQVFFFVQPRAALAVTVTPERPRYAPGQVAQLELATTLGGAPGPAAVGLFGVDESLGQLAPLPGPDELAALRPQATGPSAFAGLDALALSLGRIRGANAAAATLTRVAALPPPPAQEATVAVSGASQFDPNEAQVDRFYAVLGELHAQVRTWEATAPKGEKLLPPTMARLWGRALDAVEARRESAHDAWGRRLRLHRLPGDLLALTEPRAVVVDGTRLPEDTQNWAQWVAKEKP